ncbi:glycosyltransferase [Rhodovarius crocodyli]|uniref:Glycosyltransferase n=1 Tax=Rhodovarius crocodyli TaxID=1979269 RepID=A0A437M3L4_9PROT|nr:TIGR04282 family arsenosugar biosynthesis glycosyltransferase [Rhodovarius crocodyli]RVT92133.1 glycosyltransferase [Rhodovarius crocodyli]
MNARPPHAGSIAVAIICKTPMAGRSKTRLSPPLRPEECAAISACFIRDLAVTIDGLSGEGVRGYAAYTPAGSEPALRPLLPESFGLVLQGEGDLGDRLLKAAEDLLALGHAGVILVNSDSPTLPPAILRDAVAAVRRGGNVTLGPASDGGYTLIGLSATHPRLFAEIPWSTEVVCRLSRDRAAEIGMPVVLVDPWYDIDDAHSYAVLEAELRGTPPAFAVPGRPLQDAPATRDFVARRAAARPMPQVV